MKGHLIKGLQLVRLVPSKRRIRRLLALAIWGTATRAYASTGAPAFVPDAETAPRGHGQVALLAPSRIGLSDRVELHTAAPGWLLLSPNGGVKIALRRAKSWTFSGDFSAALPTMGMRATAGYLFPSNEVSNAKIGPLLTLQSGFLATYRGRSGASPDGDRVTFAVDSAFLAVGKAPAPLDTYAPLELLLAPATARLRIHAGAHYLLALSETVHAFFGIDGYYLGASPAPRRSPFLGALHLGATWNLSRRVALTGGVVAYNSDQRATAIVEGPRGPERRSVRSNDLFPLLDLAVGF